MSTMYVKPREGGRVRMPDRNFIPMPPTGAFVPRHDFYNRLIITGDLIITDPPAEEAAPETPDATPATVKPTRPSKEK